MATHFERYQQRLFSQTVRWANLLIIPAVLFNSLWFLWDFWPTLVQNLTALTMIFVGWRCIVWSRQGHLVRAVQVWLSAGMVLSAIIIPLLGLHFALMGTLGLCLFVSMAAILGREGRALHWGAGAIIIYLLSFTVLILKPSNGPAYSPTDIAGLYVFPVLALVAFTYLGHGAGGALRSALTKSETARHEAEWNNEALQQTQTALRKAFDDLQVELAERERAEERIKASLQEKELLLKEMHHRVKNNLQIISSLLCLQAGHTQDPQVGEILRDGQNRVRTMALVHEKLYRSENLACIDFGDYVRTLMAQLMRSYGTKLAKIDMQTEVAALRLGIDVAVPCGLIVNELVTNSLKHAFPDGRNGEVNVGLCETGDGHLLLKVRDNGVGMPQGFDYRQTESLGLQLVNALVRQLDGSVELHCEGGTTFAITFSGVR
jgi:two-component sensor histidine kinase